MHWKWKQMMCWCQIWQNFFFFFNLVDIFYISAWLLKGCQRTLPFSSVGFIRFLRSCLPYSMPPVHSLHLKMNIFYTKYLVNSIWLQMSALHFAILCSRARTNVNLLWLFLWTDSNFIFNYKMKRGNWYPSWVNKLK